MNLQYGFARSGYKNILVKNTALKYGINLADIYELNSKPEELLGIYISKQKDELYFLLNGDLKDIDTLCEDWDKRIRIFMLINGRNEHIKNLKYNVVQLIIYSGDSPNSTKEADLYISRKIMLKGDLTNPQKIILDSEIVPDLPFHMINSKAFSPNKKREKKLSDSIPINPKLLDILEMENRKIHKDKERNLNLYFEETEFDMIKRWLEK